MHATNPDQEDRMEGSDDHTPLVVLARRQNAGIRVMLLWSADTNTAAVVVRDVGAERQFELVVEPCGNALDVYRHPYAYAAWRGVDYPTASLRLAA
ncbi:MAG TPA: hypothetical protein VHC67_03420 [Gaiellaceae bacterium]|nr:hypothetical protein [Gaiellaceae bacterium]